LYHQTKRAAVSDQNATAPHGLTAALDEDGQSLRDSLTELTRVLQFRDRDCLCAWDISVTQCHALDALVVKGPMTLNDLSATLYVDKSTASRVVDGLQRKGYVQRNRNPLDGRSVLLGVTPAGEELCRDIREDLLEDCKRLLADFEPEVRAAVAKLIQRLAQAAACRVETAGGTCCRIDRR
jgi:DNA-binding MarR family transcriptional regulator